MPKIIDGLESKILQEAKKILFEEGFEALSMRRMAKECNIAVGTIYNYVKDKDDLVARITLTDWFDVVKKISLINDSAVSFEQGFINIYKGVAEFREKYNSYWKQLPNVTKKMDSLNFYHPQFRKEIEKLIEPLLKSISNKEKKDALSEVFAELIVSVVIHPDITEKNIRIFIQSINIE